MDLFSELNGLMVNYHFRPEKKLAQHFLVDDAVIQKMIGLAELKKKDTVLEIGAGTGFLTRELQKHCKIKAIEFDENLFLLLQEKLDKKNLELFQGDFLSVDVGAYNKIVSLPPYTISTELVYKILEHGFDLAVLVMQREFLEKLVAMSGFFEYNALSVFTQYRCVPELQGIVSPKSFFPTPNAFSSIIKLTGKYRFGKVKDEKKFRFFLHQLFRFKNKNLNNALHLSYPFVKKELKLNDKKFESTLKKIDFLEQKVYLLEVEYFVELFNAVFPK